MKQLELYVRADTGGTKNPIVLLHGLFGDGTQWESITELLKNEFRVITVDLLGHGKSPTPYDERSYTAPEQVKALHRSLARINAINNVTIVGYSMGGAVALSYAAAYPDDIEQLYLISTPFYLRPEQMLAANFAVSAFITKAITSTFRLAEHLLGTSEWTQKMVRYGGASNAFHKMIGAHDTTLDPFAVKNSIDKLVRDFDFCGELQKVTAPVSFFAGKKDPFIVQGQLRALKQFSPYMEIKRLSIIKVDHMLVQNLPHEIATMLLQHTTKTLAIGTDSSKGKPLVLLHGIESSSTYWDPLLPVLSQSRRVISIDLLGFGNSPKPHNIAYSLKDQVVWLDATLRAMKIDEFELAGHSLGSVVALAYAATYPRKVSKLILLSPVLAPESELSHNIIFDNLKYFYRFSDTSFAYDHTAKAIGETRLSNFLPGIRSVQNAIHNQHAEQLIGKIKHIPTIFIYGTKDQLITPKFLQKMAKELDSGELIALPGENHNFPLFAPSKALQAFNYNGTAHIKPASKVPSSFGKQIIRLSAPILLIKSVLYILGGILLFSQYAAAILTLGVVYYVVRKGYELIQGSFSLKHEGLAYIGYAMLGGFVIAAGYVLYKHPDIATKISVVSICCIVLAAGLLRIIAAIFWSPSKSIRRTLFGSGIPMAILGFAALLDSTVSIYVIVYTLALLLIVRGMQFALYTTGALVMAYIRGF